MVICESYMHDFSVEVQGCMCWKVYLLDVIFEELSIRRSPHVSLVPRPRINLSCHGESLQYAGIIT
jgi:hypothetical protein